MSLASAQVYSRQGKTIEKAFAPFLPIIYLLSLCTGYPLDPIPIADQW